MRLGARLSRVAADFPEVVGARRAAGMGDLREGESGVTYERAAPCTRTSVM